MHFLNNTFFEIFERFPKISEVYLKMVECILFYLNMVAEILLNLISPFCDENVSRILGTSGFNVKVLKINFTAFFLQFSNEHSYG